MGKGAGPPGGRSGRTRAAAIDAATTIATVAARIAHPPEICWWRPLGRALSPLRTARSPRPPVDGGALRPAGPRPVLRRATASRTAGAPWSPVGPRPTEAWRGHDGRPGSARSACRAAPHERRRRPRDGLGAAPRVARPLHHHATGPPRQWPDRTEFLVLSDHPGRVPANRRVVLAPLETRETAWNSSRASPLLGG